MAAVPNTAAVAANAALTLEAGETAPDWDAIFSGVVLDSTGDAALDEILNSAHAKFVTYDYDAALEILNSATDYAENEDLKALIASCEETKATLVPADVNKITHIFFHSLIMDNSKALDGDADEKGYDQEMTTKSQFLKILDSM